MLDRLLNIMYLSVISQLRCLCGVILPTVNLVSAKPRKFTQIVLKPLRDACRAVYLM